MASESQERKNKEAQILYLASQGMGQRAIARREGVSRQMVQRVLEKAGAAGVNTAGTVPAGQPGDFHEIDSEFRAMFDAAKGTDDIDEYRRVHKAARVCFEGGYRVSYGTLPYLVALQGAQASEDTDTPKGRQRWKGWNLEIKSVYDFTKYYRLANWRERPPVPVPADFWETWLGLVESADG